MASAYNNNSSIFIYKDELANKTATNNEIVMTGLDKSSFMNVDGAGEINNANDEAVVLQSIKAWNANANLNQNVLTTSIKSEAIKRNYPNTIPIITNKESLDNLLKTKKNTITNGELTPDQIDAEIARLASMRNRAHY